MNTSTVNLYVVVLLMLVLAAVGFSSSFLGTGEFFSDLEKIGLELNMMSMNLLFFNMVLLITIVIFTWSIFYMSSSYKGSVFHYCLMAFVFSMLLLILSNSLLLIFIGWEGLGVTSFVLILFYQNWMSGSGGLLTLLTNRLGDAVFMICLCAWASMSSSGISSGSSYWFFLGVSGLVLTKSAQWPFSSWLPAAMAAPTPVSSLVHSSTLVTAGVWLLIRFMEYSFHSVLFFGSLGMLTLTLASFSALAEVDSKKIVALSTLSQLGLMFLALSLSTTFMCYIHVITHALAKANLFIIIGGLLHGSFSQQDARFLTTSNWSSYYFLTLMLSLASLTGWTFSSGFFSKELILTSSSYSTLNSTVILLAVFLVSSLTLGYCVKLFLSLLEININMSMMGYSSSVFQLAPIFYLSVMVILMGYFITWNMSLELIFMKGIESVYWSILLMGLFFLFSSSYGKVMVFMSKGFETQLKFISFFLMLKKIKILSSMLESSLSESSILMSHFISQNLKLGTRVVMFMVALSLLLLFV